MSGPGQHADPIHNGAEDVSYLGDRIRTDTTASALTTFSSPQARTSTKPRRRPPSGRSHERSSSAPFLSTWRRSCLLDWAHRIPARIGARSAQQLVAAGERVLDIQPKLAARIRVLEAGNTSKNDPNDARSVVVAASGPGPAVR